MRWSDAATKPSRSNRSQANSRPPSTYALAAVRLLVGAAFLGAVSDAMLLGHWYLVQPGLRRDAVKELVVCTAALWPFEIAVFVIPTGMVQVFSGTVDDGYDGLLAWVWLVCAVTTLR